MTAAPSRAPEIDERNGAGNGIRTRDIKLGKLALYQLSYARPGSLRRATIARLQQPVKGAKRRRYTHAMSNVASPERSEFLYFFPEEQVTGDQLREILRAGSAERRAWAISHLLRYAEWEDIWAYVSRNEVRESFTHLELPDPLRLAWARLLKLESLVD